MLFFFACGVECVIIAHFIRRNESHWPIDTTFSVHKNNMARLVQRWKKKNRHSNETHEEAEEEEEHISFEANAPHPAGWLWVCALYYELMMSSRNQLLVVEYSLRPTTSCEMSDAHTTSSSQYTICGRRALLSPLGPRHNLRIERIEEEKLKDANSKWKEANKRCSRLRSFVLRWSVFRSIHRSVDMVSCSGVEKYIYR